MSELGVIGDLLESSGELGLAAAVRVLEYVAGRGTTISLDSVLSIAVSHLRKSGNAELAEVLDREWRNLTYRKLVDRLTPTLSDYHRILDRYPLVRAGIQSWIDDPAPKLPGISIAVTPRSGFGPEPSIQIRVEREAEGRRWVGSAMLTGTDLSHFAGRLDEMAFRHLEGLHRKMIDDLRQQPAEATR